MTYDDELTGPAHVSVSEQGRILVTVAIGAVEVRLSLLPGEAEALGRRLLGAAMSSGEAITGAASSVGVSRSPSVAGALLLEFAIDDGRDVNLMLSAEQATRLANRLAHLAPDYVASSGGPGSAPLA